MTNAAGPGGPSRIRLHQREVPRVDGADQGTLLGVAGEVMWMSRRRWTRKAPRRIVGSAFRSVSSIASRTAPMPPGLANAATPPRLSRHGPATGTRARSEPHAGGACIIRNALEIAVRAVDVVESQHRRVQQTAPFQCGQGLSRPREALFYCVECLLRSASGIRSTFWRRRGGVSRAAVAKLAVAAVAAEQRRFPARAASRASVVLAQRRCASSTAASSSSLGLVPLQIAQQKSRLGDPVWTYCAYVQVQDITRAPRSVFYAVQKQGLSRGTVMPQDFDDTVSN